MKRFHLVILLLFGQLAIAQSISMGVTGNIHKSSIANIHDVSKTPWGGGVGIFAEVSLVENDILIRHGYI